MSNKSCRLYPFKPQVSQFCCSVNLIPLWKWQVSFANSLASYSFLTDAFGSVKVYPLVIAVHPFEPNQFALGLTDGNIFVLEPLAFEGEWGASSPVEDGVGPSMTSGTTSSDQPPLPTADEASLSQIWATRLRPRRQRPPPCDLGTATVKKERKKRRCWNFNCAESWFWYQW